MAAPIVAAAIKLLTSPLAKKAVIATVLFLRRKENRQLLTNIKNNENVKNVINHLKHTKPTVQGVKATATSESFRSAAAAAATDPLLRDQAQQAATSAAFYAAPVIGEAKRTRAARKNSKTPTTIIM